MKTKIALTLIVAVAIGAFAWAQVANSNYIRQGGVVSVFGGQINAGFQEVALTSPTVTFSVVGKSFVELTSDANLTGIVPTGGELYQILVIKSGAGSNTLRFDDGTSTTIGGDITLTEAQEDLLFLVCIDAQGDEWARIATGDN